MNRNYDTYTFRSNKWTTGYSPQDIERKMIRFYSIDKLKAELHQNTDSTPPPLSLPLEEKDELFSGLLIILLNP